MQGVIKAVCISEKKGMEKHPVSRRQKAWSAAEK